MPGHRIECDFISLQEHCENSEENDRIGLCLECQRSTGTIPFRIIINRPYIDVFAFFTLYDDYLSAFHYSLFMGRKQLISFSFILTFNKQKLLKIHMQLCDFLLLNSSPSNPT